MKLNALKNPFVEISMAIREVFSDWKKGVLAFVLAIGFFVLLVMIPVWTTPGSDFFFHLTLVDWQLIVLMIVLSLLNGVLIVLQGYLQIEKWKLKRTVSTGSGLTALGSMVIGLLSASIACVACYSSLLALFGLGVTTFVFEYRYLLATGSALLALIALWYTARAVNGHCAVCSLEGPAKH